MRQLVLLCAILISLTMAGVSQDEVIAGWTFPENNLGADTGSVFNLGNLLETLGGTSEIELKNGYETKAAQASGWNLGMGEKAWIVLFSTMNYSNIALSSRQQSGGNDPGPKNFQVEYSIDNGTTWVLVVGGEVTVENDWETSYVNKLSLPSECNDQLLVEIRWIMSTNIASGAGGAVQENGKSKIDDIFIHGDKISAVGENDFQPINIGPNPASDFIKVKNEKIIDRIQVIDYSGKTVFIEDIGINTTKLDISHLPKGSYILSVESKSLKIPYRQRIIKVD